MIKIFVTGDNHIGLKYASHEHASILSSRRIEAFDGMVQRANEEDCTLFIITGDLFHTTGSVAKATVKTILDSLSHFHGTVAVLPGNHDYYDNNVRVWQYFKELIVEHDNILLLTDYRPYELEVDEQRVVLYPALCTSLHSAAGENNLGWIKAENITPNDTYRIGIAHGAVEGETIDSEGRYFLMSRAELDSIPLDAWLIGHTHVPFPRGLTEELVPTQDKVFNAGTHVQTDVACNTEGICFVIEIAEDKTIRAKKVISGNLRFHRKHITLTAGMMEECLHRTLAELDDNSVVDVIFSGAVTAEEYEARHAVVGAALGRFVEGTYTDYALSKLISKTLIDAEFPETSFSAGLLTALLDEPKEAQLVYELLAELKEGR